MISLAYIREWRQNVPWLRNDQVEQDLIICRALVEIFSHPDLKEHLAHRVLSLGDGVEGVLGHPRRKARDAVNGPADRVDRPVAAGRAPTRPSSSPRSPSSSLRISSRVVRYASCRFR